MEQWKSLRQTDERLPSLLIKGSFSNQGYSIYVTDLSRIWTENLEKAAITARARRSNCSVDPSEDAEQYDIFLEKLQSALQQRGGTSLALSTTKHGELKLNLEAPLPSPLPAFQWEVNLRRTADRSVELDLVSPLLQQVQNLNHLMQLLIAEIQAKDKIIAKITDRLETSGHDLTAVFPGVANVKVTKRKSQQEQLARHVRGLGKFDESAWAAKVAAGNDSLSTSHESLDTVFASIPNAVNSAPRHDLDVDWLEQLPRGSYIDLRGTEMPDTTAACNNRSDDGKKPHGTSDDDNDEFQRQATPPHLRDSPQAPQNTLHDVPMEEAADDKVSEGEESTEDEDDLDGPPVKSKPLSHHEHHGTPHRGSGSKARLPSSSPSPLPTADTVATAGMKRGPFSHEEDTNDDEDDLDGSSQPSQKVRSISQLATRQRSSPPRSSPPTKASPRKKLGTFGERPRTKSPTPMSIAPTEEHQNPASSTPSPEKPKPKAKLGMIGGSKAKSQTPVPDPPSSPPKASLPAKRIGTIGDMRETKSLRAATTSATPGPQHRESNDVRKQEEKGEHVEPEDPIERANAKRIALERELAEKAKAPAKKKRKF